MRVEARMTTRRSKRLNSAHQNPPEDEKFKLDQLDQSVDQATRSKRISVGQQEAKPSTKTRRQTMLAVVTEEKSNTAASSRTTLVSTRRSGRLEAKKMLPPITRREGLEDSKPRRCYLPSL